MPPFHRPSSALKTATVELTWTINDSCVVSCLVSAPVADHFTNPHILKLGVSLVTLESSEATCSEKGTYSLAPMGTWIAVYRVPYGRHDDETILSKFPTTDPIVRRRAFRIPGVYMITL